MLKLHQVLASCIGIGYLKGGGTIAALVTCLLWLFCLPEHTNNNITLAITFLVTAYGIYCSNIVEPFWGKDSSKVVIDEIAGMCVTLIAVPNNVKAVFVGFVLFRFFDITKPLFIRKLEKLPGGLGVMLDDLLAGIYANMLLQIIVAYTNL
ncbi:MAG: phosphatidylglycerophosphatase A [Chitinophagaceae bacterium]|jgi:phosphatidylglycerophosphatase A